MKKSALVVAGIIFLIVAVAHFLRYYQAMPIVAGDFTVPMDWSFYGGFVAAFLALWMFIAARK